MRVAELAAFLGCPWRGEGSLEVSGITHVAQKVQPGWVFAALPGLRHHGLDFLTEALARRAVAVISDRDPKANVTWIKAENPREATARAAWLLAGNPQHQLTMVGVTGTNGKSTVCDLIACVLKAFGRPTGVFGTLGYRLPNREVPASRTTPEPCDLAPLLAELAQYPAACAVMEVSSHALMLERVTGLAFDVACWTNFTQDHLDFHRTMDAYFAAKRRIFDLLRRSPPGRRVLPTDDPALTPLLAEKRPGDVTFGLHAPADVTAHEVAYDLSGTSFRLVTPEGEATLRFPLLGEHNVKNALAAAACAVAVGVPLSAIVAGLSQAKPLPGRLEPVPVEAPFHVFVDYAHTPDALEKVLATLRPLTPGRLIVVFGCGGDRDQGKRPLMGAVAARWADVPIVTSDNPRSEDPTAIIAQILEGAATVSNPRTLVLPDRRDAIDAALRLAEPGSVVVLAGKGHEQEQIFADRTVPFSDRQVALELAKRRNLG